MKEGGRVGRGARVDRVAISPGSAQGKQLSHLLCVSSDLDETKCLQFKYSAKHVLFL